MKNKILHKLRIALLICAIATYIIYTLQKHKGFKWLKYLS